MNYQLLKPVVQSNDRSANQRNCQYPTVYVQTVTIQNTSELSVRYCVCENSDDTEYIASHGTVSTLLFMWTVSTLLFVWKQWRYRIQRCLTHDNTDYHMHCVGSSYDNHIIEMNIKVWIDIGLQHARLYRRIIYICLCDTQRYSETLVTVHLSDFVTVVTRIQSSQRRSSQCLPNQSHGNSCHLLSIW